MKYTNKKKRNCIKKTSKKNTNKTAKKNRYKKGGISLFGYEYDTGIGNRYRNWREKVNEEKQKVNEEKQKKVVQEIYTLNSVPSHESSKENSFNTNFDNFGNQYCYNSVGIHRDKIINTPEYKKFGKKYCDELFQQNGIFNYKKVIKEVIHFLLINGNDENKVTNMINKFDRYLINLLKYDMPETKIREIEEELIPFLFPNLAPKDPKEIEIENG